MIKALKNDAKAEHKAIEKSIGLKQKMKGETIMKNEQRMKEESIIEAIKTKGGLEELSMEELNSIAGGSILEEGKEVEVDMSVYSPVYFSLAMGAALAYKSRGYSREQAIEAVYNDYRTKYYIIMNNLDQCITQERWDKY